MKLDLHGRLHAYHTFSGIEMALLALSNYRACGHILAGAFSSIDVLQYITDSAESWSVENTSCTRVVDFVQRGLYKGQCHLVAASVMCLQFQGPLIVSD